MGKRTVECLTMISAVALVGTLATAAPAAAETPDRYNRSGTPTWQTVAKSIYTGAQDRRREAKAPAFQVKRSPSVNRGVAKRVKKVVTSAYRSWNSVAPLPSRYPLVIINASSQRWFKEVSRTFPDDNCGPQWWIRVRATPERSNGAVCSSRDHGWSYLVIFLGSDARTIPRWLAIHEVVHVAQAQLLGAQAMNSMECWLGEGMAELYTGALTFTPPARGREWSGTKAYRNMVVSNLKILSTPPRSVSDPEYWLGIIQRSEDRSTHLCWGFGIGYSLGYLVTEKLVLDFGEEGLMSWMRLTKRGQDSDAAFEQVFGISQQTWYEQAAAPYVAREVRLILGS